MSSRPLISTLVPSVSALLSAPLVSTFIFFDIETTGLLTPVHNPRITEICFHAVGRNEFVGSLAGVNPRVVHKLSLCFRPGALIDPVASEITKLTDAKLKNELEFDGGAHQLISSFIGRFAQPACLVAHYGDAFDFPILKAELARIGKDLPQDLLVVDSLKIFQELETGVKPTTEPLAKKSRTSYSKNRVSYKIGDVYKRRYKKKPKVLHAAEADVETLLLASVATAGEFARLADANASTFGQVYKLW